ncbi:MAG TPA: prepilin peptidase [Sphingorhabdus lacus]|nr:prepilin peptidase [Sphingorhabdus lacus]
MNGEALTYALVGGLAIALIYSIYTDVRYRLIFNRVTLLIALAAPAYWAATGGFNLPEIGLHLRTATIVFIFFLIAFRFGAMGGGDVKLFAALALWWHWIDVVRMVLYASILGALVTIVFVMIHKAKQQDGKARIPYGVAIALAGLWIAGERIFNHFT